MISLKKEWRSIPIAVALIPFALGIVVSQSESWIVILAMTILPVFLMTREWRPLFLVIVSFGFLGCAAGSLKWHTHFIESQTIHNLNLPSPATVLHIEQKKKSTSIKLMVAEHRLLIQARVQPSDSSILVGDTLILKKLNFSPSWKTNPYEFDYKNWLKLQGLVGSINLTSSDYNVVRSRRHSIISSAADLQSTLSKLLDTLLPNRETAALTKGMVLGQKSTLKKRQKTIFEDTGTLHVMAVSGLHVGIVAFILMLVTNLLAPKKIETMKVLAVVVGVWSFVLITGLKVSGIRAALMICALLAAKVISRKSSNINTLCFAALVMLSVNPIQLFQIGFQFSFAAVLSILIFYPKVKVWLRSTNTFLDSLLQLISLSLSVQILLAPISIYYFHQFPLNFIVSNIIAIPMVSLVIPLALTSMILSLISMDLALSVGQILDGFINIGMQLLDQTNSTMFSKLDNIWPSLLNICLFYLFIILIMWYVRSKRHLHLRLSALVLLLILVFNFYQVKDMRGSYEIIAYAYPYMGQIDLFCQSSAYLFQTQDSNLRNPAFRSRRLGPTGSSVSLPDTSVWFSLENLKISIVQSEVRNGLQDSDIYIFSERHGLSQLIDLVAEGSTVVKAFYSHPNTHAHWRQSMRNHCIDLWDVNMDGPWLLSDHLNRLKVEYGPI